MDNIKDELLSMKIGVYKEIIFSNGILKSTKELCRIAEGEWALESHSCGWSIIYLDLNKAVAYFEGIKQYELDWEDNEIIL